MKRVSDSMKWLVSILALFLVTCSGNGIIGEAEEYETDPVTGLPFNPTTVPTTEFVVDGRVQSLSLTPQTAPEFVVQAPSGKTYRIRSQALSNIHYDDGQQVLVHEFRNNMRVTATVRRDPDSGNLVSDDFTVMRPLDE